MAEKKKKKIQGHKWTPEKLVVYLLKKNPLLLGCGGYQIKKMCPELSLNVHRLIEIINHPDFNKTVIEVFRDKVCSKDQLKTMFWGYLMYYLEKHTNIPDNALPSSKPLDYLGALSGEYNPKQQGGDINISFNAEKKKKINDWLKELQERRNKSLN